MRSHFDYIQSRCTRGSFIFCHKHGSLAMLLAFIPNKFDQFDWFVPNLLDAFIKGAISNTPRVGALGVVSFSAISTAVSRRCSRSFLTG
jgi:hypothetical protein